MAKLVQLIGVYTVFTLVACGPSVPKAETLSSLREAMSTPVVSAEDSAARSRLVEDAAESGAIDGMSRGEVEETFGKGDPCSRNAICSKNGFSGTDVLYHVGTMGGGYGGKFPMLIVGFNPQGKVNRTWNFRTH